MPIYPNCERGRRQAHRGVMPRGRMPTDRRSDGVLCFRGLVRRRRIFPAPFIVGELYLHSPRSVRRHLCPVPCRRHSARQQGNGELLHSPGPRHPLFVRCDGAGQRQEYDEYLAAAASRSFRPRALGIGDIERNGCQRCGVLKRPYILFDGSRAGQRRDRVVRRCGKLHLVVAYLVGRLRPGNNGADLFVRGCLYGPQYRSTHHRLHAALIARALLPVGPQRPLSASGDLSGYKQTRRRRICRGIRIRCQLSPKRRD